MDKRSKIFKWFNMILLVAFAGVIILNYWSAFEKQKLNQRYERLIEQYETELISLKDLNQDIRLMADHLKNLADLQGN